MPIIQKQNATLRKDMLIMHEDGVVIPSQFFKVDGDGHAVLPGPVGATIIKAGTFSLMDEGAFIPGKYVQETPQAIIVSGEILLIDPNGSIVLPMRLVPSARTVIARERGAANNILLKAHGGVGDIVCAEPAIRFAVERFKDQRISLCTDYPEFFQHLKFEKVYPASGDGVPDYSKFLLFQNFSLGDELAWEFVAHPLTHAVDYAALNMWRLTLPVHLKEIVVRPTDSQIVSMRKHLPANLEDIPIVAIHPGKTWDSRTFPKKWWDTVISEVSKACVLPVIIGGLVDKQKDGSYRAGTVEVDVPTGALDLRGKLSFIETVALLQEARVLLTNDSSPLHMAASGSAWIGFCSTVKDPSHLLHWRNGEWGWRMKNFTDSNLFEVLNFCPNQEKEVHVDKAAIQDLLRWLPDPKEFAQWAAEKCK